MRNRNFARKTFASLSYTHSSIIGEVWKSHHLHIGHHLGSPYVDYYHETEPMIIDCSLCCE